MTNSPKLWSKEYKQKGIPSSFLRKPSGITKLLDRALIKNKVAADLGCGRGRNTFWLIKNGATNVYAVDFVKEAAEEVAAQKNRKVKAICHDLAKPWPIPTNSLDLILDIFCFKHQTTLTNQKFYISEINRTLKPGGHLLLDLAAIDDGFYGIQPKKEIKPNIYRITDPATKVGSMLYTKDSLLKAFTNFKLIEFKNDKKLGLMHGKKYKRSTLKFLLQKM